jgi:hypothetical protein
MYFARIPLKTSAQIVHGNALRMDWDEVTPAGKLTHIMGNPPFLGYTQQNTDQKSDMSKVCSDLSTFGTLDYVSAWYIKTVNYMITNNAIKSAFVSTNSITQGEQVSILWGWLINHGVVINFGHKTFSWNNEAKGKAAVHCVIIGFGLLETKKPKYLFEYVDIQGDPHKIRVKQLNPYLAEARNIFISTRNYPITSVPIIKKGSQPTDGGNLLFTNQEKIDFINKEPLSAIWFKRFISAHEYLHGKKRWCLWLKDANPTELKKATFVIERINNVKNMRLASKKKATNKWADFPMLFTEDRQPSSSYLLIPRHSSENRRYIPFGFFSKDNIVADSCLFVGDSTPYHFGVITSEMHMAWMRTVCGRIKSDYRYSANIVYNNYPWPLSPSDKQKKNIEDRAQAVLDAREKFPDATLADLYDPLTMPPALLKAHQALDKAVDAAYSKKKFKTEAERVAFLFDLYQQYTGLLPKETTKGKKKKT